MLYDHSKTVLDKITYNKKPTAVFRITLKKGYAFRTTKFDGDLFKKAMVSTDAYLVGVYDRECKPEWLDEDMTYALND